MRNPLTLRPTAMAVLALLLVMPGTHAEPKRAPLDETQLTDEQLAEPVDVAVELQAIEQAFSADLPGEGLSRWRDLFTRNRHQLVDRR